jgi:hypothetical protein
MEQVGDGFTDYQQARIHALEAALREAVTLVRYLSDDVPPDEEMRQHARWFVAKYRGMK